MLIELIGFVTPKHVQQTPSKTSQKQFTIPLKKAQHTPQDYRDLLVRVAGYSDYFIDLDEYHQEEIIARTEQGAF